MISYEKVKEFLENILQFPKTWEDILKKDEVEFLRLFMLHHARRIPFQTVTMTSTPYEKRRRPTVDDIISQGLTGVGGCCINLNYFAKILLCAIGFDAFAIQGTHNMAPVAGTHCMVGVNIRDGKGTYLVEVGGAFPILEPVPMHNLPFKILTAGGFPYEFRLTEEGLVRRYQVEGGLYNGRYIGKPEALRTSWDLTPRKFHEYDYPMDETFTNPVNSSLLRGFMMCRYFFPEEAQKILKSFHEGHSEGSNANGFQNGYNKKDFEDEDTFIFMWKRKIVIGNKYARLFVKEYPSYPEMIEDIVIYFPMLDKNEVEATCQEYQKFEVKSNPYDFIL